MKWFLLVAVFTAGHGGLNHKTEMPSMEACFSALREVRMTVSPGADNEGVVVAYCYTAKP